MCFECGVRVNEITPHERYCLRLSPAQRDIMRLLTLGLENKEIAQRLGIQHNTLAGHMGRISKRLNVSGRYELMVWAFRHNCYHKDSLLYSAVRNAVKEES